MDREVVAHGKVELGPKRRGWLGGTKQKEN